MYKIYFICQQVLLFNLHAHTLLHTHHGEPLTLADHAHVLLSVRNPVFAGWGLVWRLELGRRAAFSAC